MNKNIWLFFLLVILLIGVVALGLEIENRLLGRNPEFCASPEYMRMPVIAEFRSDSVVLSGSQYELKKGKSYQFGDGEFTVQVKLLDITDHSATFFIDAEEPYYEPSKDPPYIRGPYMGRDRCKIVVAYDDDTYLSQFSDIQIRPIDLEERWGVDKYTEYADVLFQVQEPIGQARILISATHDSVPYSILQVWYRYDSEDSAAAAFKTESEYVGMSGRETTHYPSLANNFYEGCEQDMPASCSYMAQYHEYLVEVRMRVSYPHVMKDSPIPVEDWHFLLSQVEARLTQ